MISPPDNVIEGSQLKRAGIDVSVRLGYGNYVDLDPQRLMDLELVPMCKPGLDTDLNSVESLRKQSLLWDSTLSRFRDSCDWKKWFQQHACEETEPLRELRFGNGLLALEAALSGQGILLGSKDLLQAELSAEKLAVIIDHPIICPQAYYVVSAGLNNERPIAKAFREWLLDEINTPEI